MATIYSSAKSGKRDPSELKIKKNPDYPTKDPNKKYIFEYTIYEFIVSNSDNEIEIGLGKTNFHSIHIHEFCCSNPNAIKYKLYNLADQELVSFGDKPEKISLACTLAPRELINLGLIVSIAENPGDTPELILCDPQIGNGPGNKSSVPSWFYALPI